MSLLCPTIKQIFYRNDFLNLFTSLNYSSNILTPLIILILLSIFFTNKDRQMNTTEKYKIFKYLMFRKPKTRPNINKDIFNIFNFAQKRSNF